MGMDQAFNKVAEEAVFAKGGYPALVQYKVQRVVNTLTACCH